MIKFTKNTYNRAVEFKIILKTDQPVKVGIIVSDASKKNTVYTKRWNTVSGKDVFFIKLPQSPETATFEIYDINSREKSSEHIKVVSVEALILRYNLSVVGLKNPDVVSFIKLSQEFSQKAGYLSSGVYLSDDGKFVIKYSDKISDGYGGSLSTPARINIQSGRIEVLKPTFERYTVAGRMAILLHEFSHVYQNKDSANEVEADLNAARIYLGLGYPRIEFINTFANVFYNADTEGNRNRIKQMRDFIAEFDKKNSNA